MIKMCERAWENTSPMQERTIYVKTQQDILPFPPSFLYLFSLIPGSKRGGQYIERARVNGSGMMNDWGFARGPRAEALRYL